MPRHILVADDSATIQRVVQIAFAREDVRLTQTRSVDEALAAARRDRPDVVLADASLEGKTGYDLCAQIKSDQSLRGVPVIILAGIAAPWDENKGKNVGADGHVQKPFETQLLLDRVSDAIAKAPARPAAMPAAGAPTPPPKPMPAPAPAPSATPRPLPSPASLFAPKPAPLPAPPSGLGRPPMIGGAKLAAPAMAAVPAKTPPSVAPQNRTMLGMPAQQPVRVATPMAAAPAARFAAPAPAPIAPKPAPPPAVRAAISERVAEKVAQFAAGGPEYAAIAKLSKEIIEQIAWEVVPELAEAIIRSELERLVPDKNR